MALLLALAQSAPAQTVASPNGKVIVTVTLIDGRPGYAVTYQGKSFLESSPLGLESSIGSFASGLAAAGSQVKPLDESYTLPHGKVREVHYRANELTCRFTNPQRDSLEVIFRVSDRDVALAYRVSSRSKKRIVITS